MRLVLRLLVDFRDCAVDRGLPLANSQNVRLILIHLGLLVLVALPCHLTEVRVSHVLGLRATHLGLYAANLGLLARVVAPQTSLLDPLLDLARRQQLPLLEHLIGALLKLQAQRAQALRRLLCVRVNALLTLTAVIGHVVLHPVDVEGAGLCAIDRLLVLTFNHF